VVVKGQKRSNTVFPANDDYAMRGAGGGRGPPPLLGSLMKAAHKRRQEKNLLNTLHQLLI
jgi:hypothetical protein